MKVQSLICAECNEVIFSRATHDFNSCHCGETSIDGGRDYCRVIYLKRKPISFQLELPKNYSAKLLYADWNSGGQKYGNYPAPWPKWVGGQAGMAQISKAVGELE